MFAFCLPLNIIILLYTLILRRATHNQIHLQRYD
jgi:hypothetical protein